MTNNLLEFSVVKKLSRLVGSKRPVKLLVKLYLNTLPSSPLDDFHERRRMITLLFPPDVRAKWRIYLRGKIWPMRALETVTSGRFCA